MSNPRLLKSLLLLSLVPVLPGCALGGLDGSGKNTYNVSGFVMNGSELDSIDVVFEDKHKFSGVEYGFIYGPEPITITSPSTIKVYNSGGSVPLTTQNTLNPEKPYFWLVYGQASEPFVAKVSPDSDFSSSNTTIHVILGDWMDTSKYDVYMTAPGAALTAADKKLADITYKWNQFPHAIEAEPGKSYQIRLCKPGTTTVVEDLSVVPEIGTTIDKDVTYVLMTGRKEGMHTTLLFKAYL
jgi:hypothetical protein